MTPEAAQDLQAYFGMEIFGDDDDEDDSDQDFESKNENTMKLTESKLRKIIREEIDSYALSREYQKVANRAFEESRDNPNVGLTHIRSMLHAAEGIALELEYSQLNQQKTKKLLDALGDARLIAKELNEEI